MLYSVCLYIVFHAIAVESRDKAITLNTAQYLVWATGPRGTVDGFAYYHAKRTPNLQTTLQFGRTPVDNCGTPPSCMVVQVCPYAQEYLDERDKNSTFVAEIGQSGGNRGYQALTGVSTLDLQQHTYIYLQPCMFVYTCVCMHYASILLEVCLTSLCMMSERP